VLREVLGARARGRILKVKKRPRRPWGTRAAARTDLFGYLELFCNGQRRHWHSAWLQALLTFSYFVILNFSRFYQMLTHSSKMMSLSPRWILKTASEL
jgi:hypothetical protein